MAPWMIAALTLFNAGVAGVCCYEGRWKWALYYLGATLINVAILWMEDES